MREEPPSFDIGDDVIDWGAVFMKQPRRIRANDVH
jgi:hypothetical protein